MRGSQSDNESRSAQNLKFKKKWTSWRNRRFLRSAS